MHSIVKTYAVILLALPALVLAQEQDVRKCRTFDRFLAGTVAGIDAKISATVTRTERQTSVLSPSKHFRIHFDTTGTDQPAMVTVTGARIAGTARVFVDSVAKVFDSVWTTEITTFGFTAPPADNGEGGGNEFDVYIYDRGPNDFGETFWSDTPVAGSPLRYPAYINIDNDFGTGFRTMGMAGLRSVAAHEFFHAVQVGGYAWRGDDIYFYELTAESMEPTVFASSKDYVNDIGKYFKNIEYIQLYNSSSVGYERAIWGIFLMKRHGVDIMRQLWNAIATVKPLPATKSVLEQNGTTMAKEFAEFSYWNFFTGARADSVKYYADAKLFPSVNIRDRRTLTSTAAVFQYMGKGFAANYLQAVHGTDTASFIVANLNMDDAFGTQTNEYAYQLNVSMPSSEWKADFSVSDPANWKFTSLVNAALQEPASAYGYPNPFHPEKQKFYIGPIAAGVHPKLAVYTAGYDLVYSEIGPTETDGGSIRAVWDGRNTQGNLVASGVYIYILTAGDIVVKGKIAVVR